MGAFSKISQDAFESIQVEAGTLLKSFDPSNPSIQDDDIISATTGGINVSCVPSYTDFLEDVDNAPNNTKEGKRIDGWDCKISCNCINNTPETIKLALGAADIDGTNSAKVVPRSELKGTDYSDVWWVGERTDGGLVAARLIDALSTGGYTLQTTKKGKGQVAMELTGHTSLSTPDLVPMEFYAVAG